MFRKLSMQKLCSACSCLHARSCRRSCGSFCTNSYHPYHASNRLRCDALHTQFPCSPFAKCMDIFWHTIHPNENYGLYTIIKNRIFTFVVYIFDWRNFCITFDSMMLNHEQFRLSLAFVLPLATRHFVPSTCERCCQIRMQHRFIPKCKYMYTLNQYHNACLCLCVCVCVRVQYNKDNVLHID